MKRFIGILQFLTRIPIPVEVGIDELFYKSLIYFPLVGIILGICYYMIGLGSLFLFNPLITAAVVLLGTVILTGGLHIDGVGDTFDGLYSYRSKERILEIMKDSRLGTNALLAIVFLLLFKAIFIYHLLIADALWGIMIMPVYGRISSMWACYKTQTPRQSGMGNIFIGKTSVEMLFIGISYGLIYVCGIVYLAVGKIDLEILGHVSLLFIVLFLVRVFIKSVDKKIGGITGDILGAICEFAELIYLVSFYFLMRSP